MTVWKLHEFASHDLSRYGATVSILTPHGKLELILGWQCLESSSGDLEILHLCKLLSRLLQGDLPLHSVTAKHGALGGSLGAP